MPPSMRVAARLLQTVKLRAPAREDRRSESPVRAKAATLMTSNQTKRLKMSRVRQKPCMAARNSSMTTWNVARTRRRRRREDEGGDEQRRHESGEHGARGIGREGNAERHLRAGRPAPEPVDRGPLRGTAGQERTQIATATATRVDTTSATRESSPSPSARSIAATSSGRTTGKGSSPTRLMASAFEELDLLRMKGAVALVDLERQGEEQGRDRRAHHDVGQYQRLYDRVDGGRPGRMVIEDRRPGPPPVPEPEQQHIGRGLGHRHAADEMDVVAARHHAVEADGEQASGDEQHGTPALAGVEQRRAEEDPPAFVAFPEVHHEQPRRHDDPALEAAARCRGSVERHIDAEHQREGAEDAARQDGGVRRCSSAVRRSDRPARRGPRRAPPRSGSTVPATAQSSMNSSPTVSKPRISKLTALTMLDMCRNSGASRLTASP